LSWAVRVVLARLTMKGESKDHEYRIADYNHG